LSIKPAAPARRACNIWGLLALALLAAAADLFGACGGGSGSVAQRPTAPAPAAPRDVIVFGARAEDGTYGLYLVRGDGTDLRKLANEPGPVSWPRWSPAGDRVAYVAGGDSPSLRVYDFATGRESTLSTNALSSDLGPALSWSPEGERLAFIEDTSGGRLRIHDLREDELLDIGDVAALAVEWSPESETLAVVRPGASAQESEIATVKPDGGSARSIISGSALEGGIAWSLDGERLAVWSAPSAQVTARTLAIYEPDGDKQSDLGGGLDPAWSLDGRLAYSRPQSSDAGAGIDLYVLPADGRDPQALVQSAALARWPSWSPTSDALVYQAQVDQDTALLCIAEPETAENSCLDLAGLQPGPAAWSPF
jgi:Tol biopolymer transport system component